MKLHYTDKGKNTRQTVVFVHGFCESSFIWDDFVTHLSASFRVITVDLPGFGQTPLP
ncbi:MAG: alpha/beta fold hydrolase, partial [Flammeovirgaceae bacterium]